MLALTAEPQTSNPMTPTSDTSKGWLREPGSLHLQAPRTLPPLWSVQEVRRHDVNRPQRRLLRKLARLKKGEGQYVVPSAEGSRHRVR